MNHIKRKFVSAIILIVVAVGVYFVFFGGKEESEPRYVTAAVEKGALIVFGIFTHICLYLNGLRQKLPYVCGHYQFYCQTGNFFV